MKDPKSLDNNFLVNIFKFVSFLKIWIIAQTVLVCCGKPSSNFVDSPFVEVLSLLMVHLASINFQMILFRNLAILKIAIDKACKRTDAVILMNDITSDSLKYE